MNQITENSVTLLVLLRAAKQPVTAHEIAKFADSPLTLILNILVDEEKNAFIEKQPRRKCQVSEVTCSTWRITPIGETSLQAYLDSTRV